MTTIAPGGVVGILGGGQLGRMLALAAAPLGLRCHVFCPDRLSPAFHVADAHTRADYTDKKALAQFADAVDVITYEFENIPSETVEYLDKRRPVRPALQALTTAQDRLFEKDFMSVIGVPTAPYHDISNEEELARAAADIGFPCVVKTRRFGYDGKGQVRLDGPDDVNKAWASLNTDMAIVEGFVRFDREISVVVARSTDGRMASWPVCENTHENHILRETRVPADLTDPLHETASQYAQSVAEALAYEGVLALEMFVIESEGRLLANEIAPRVHNSGHWTIEGAVTSQFEQHLRAICGLPLGATDLRGMVRMRNLLGKEAEDWQKILSDPMAHLHLYGKVGAAPGRKMGHVTWVDQD